VLDQLRHGVTPMAPGMQQGLPLVTDDIEAAAPSWSKPARR
jgi:hypothetical protein